MAWSRISVVLRGRRRSVVAVAVRSRKATRGIRGGDSSRRPNLNDPYELAYLRGGKNELLQVATVSLIERRLLLTDDRGKEASVKAFQRRAAETVASPIGAYLLRYFEDAKPAHLVLQVGEGLLPSAVATYRHNLEAVGRGATMQFGAVAPRMPVSRWQCCSVWRG